LHGDAPDTRNRSQDLIERGLQQIRTMTTALLPQAKVEDRCLSANDFTDVVMLARTLSAQHMVTIASELDQQSDIWVPSTVFRQVMLNLLLNAIKAAGQSGQVHARLSTDAQRVSFVIANTGSHLTDDSLQTRLHIDDDNDPLGFGLWICHEFAVRYGGEFISSVAADVTPPFATCLSFWLPNQFRHDHQKPAAD
jgi:signal transduction histidine kinase